jgi:hypothetical protein
MQNGQKPNSSEMGNQIGQREQLEKMIQDMLNSGNLSPEMKQVLQEILQMNDNIQKDIINNNLNNNTILRDKQITTKLLEAEKAENQRKMSNQRQSNTTDDILHSVPDSLKPFYLNSIKKNDLLKKNSIKLINFYNQYYNGYLHRLTN